MLLSSDAISKFLYDGVHRRRHSPYRQSPRERERERKHLTMARCLFAIQAEPFDATQCCHNIYVFICGPKGWTKWVSGLIWDQESHFEGDEFFNLKNKKKKKRKLDLTHCDAKDVIEVGFVSQLLPLDLNRWKPVSIWKPSLQKLPTTTLCAPQAHNPIASPRPTPKH